MTRMIPTMSPGPQRHGSVAETLQKGAYACLLTSPEVLLAHELMLLMSPSLSFTCLITLAAPACIF